MASTDALCDTLRSLMARALQEGGHRLIDAATKDLLDLVGQFLQSQESSIPTTSSILLSSTHDDEPPPSTTTTTEKKMRQSPHRALGKVLRRELLVDIDALREAYASSSGGLLGSSGGGGGAGPSDDAAITCARVPGLTPHTALVRELQLQALLHFVLGTLGLMESKRGGYSSSSSSSSMSSSSSFSSSVSPSLLKRVHRYLADLQLRQTFSLGGGGNGGVRRVGSGSALRRNSSVVTLASTVSQTSASSTAGSVGLWEEEDTTGG